MKYEKIKKYRDEKFRRITGLKERTYEKCVEILKAKYKEEHIKNVRKSGRKSKLTIEDKLLATHWNICENIGNIAIPDQK